MDAAEMIESLVDQEYATRLACCRAGRVSYPEPCPWHGESDPMYAHTREREPIGSSRAR
jgi:hypothetical protein